MSTIRSIIKGCGSYLPERIMTNADMARFVETSDDWISERTGIRQRHIAADDEKTSDLAIKAAERALDMAGIAASDLDMIVLATATPDQTFPATATSVQHALGMHKGFAFDLQAVCSGFVYALNTADNFIKAGQVKRALVIGAETFTRILDYEDRTTCVLFGDGAGAVVLEAGEGAGQPQDRGILASRLHSDGRYGDMLYVDGGPSSTGTTGHVRMKGREVFRHAVVNLAAVMEEILADVGLTSQDVDWVVPHQANRRILEGTAKKLALSPDKVIMTVDRHANTSAASIPLALDEAVRDGRIKSGDLLMLEAMGGGFTWGGCLVRW
ncbi:3-oxoacyl-[acyl-carrier-protein] synthase 3 [Iodidimonas nitroreducens]|uniref:Beta-ketoacyl-[acyl-carrier-protein] synthase III n=1 Tax=Iodidimonas nitroreducens TaxID=1236968 RepID=A0A5A7N8D6_9PROT|nr:beta-ketoacyl-ACP synthase III [Iodidimonas nitroreducens]GAK33365.1 3-oxoacyl-[acyl-carrier-protein] synthase 3 [alpha proteobacterium Q-1]GER04601.1 3-oxoacyl-[acyl-carrier-protein] synthase 3 [Iodidimonas nitroreducens]